MEVVRFVRRQRRGHGDDGVEAVIAAVGGVIEEGRKLYEEIAEEDPKDFSARLRLSQIYRQQNQMDKAWAEHNKAKEIEPANLEIKYNEVNLYETQGKTAEAVNSLKELLTATQKRNYS